MVKDGAHFTIYNWNTRLLITGSSYLFKLLISKTKFRVSWIGIICTKQDLHVERIVLEDDPIDAISRIRDRIKIFGCHLNFCNILNFLNLPISTGVWYIFWEVNSIID